MTFNTMFSEAVENEEIRLVYSLWWLKKSGLEGTINSNSTLDWNIVNHQEVNEMMEKNELGLKFYKLFSSPLGNNLFVFIFAKTIDDAKLHFKSEFKYMTDKMFDVTNNIDRSMYHNGKVKSFREIRKEKLEFPCTVMIYEKPQITEKRRGL